MTKKDRNEKLLRLSYDRLCSATSKKVKMFDENTDIKVIKDAFSAVKEGVNIGQLLDGDSGNSIRVIFEGAAEEYAQ